MILFEVKTQSLKTALDVISTLMVNPLPAKHAYSRFYLFYTVFLSILYQIKSQLLRAKCTFRHQELQMIGLKLNKYE